MEPEPEPEPTGRARTVCGRHATLAHIRQADAQHVSYKQGTFFDTVFFGPNAVPVEHNSLLLVPGLLNTTECAQLIAEAEQLHAAKSQVDTLDKIAAARRKLLMAELSDPARALFEQMLRERLLPLLSRELPQIADYIWVRSADLWESAERRDLLPPLEPRVPGQGLGSLPYRFSQLEPAINRYSAGGNFPAHIDGHALTVNVLLQSEAFEGGGTQFWNEDGEASDAVPTAVVHPTPGTVSTHSTARRADLAAIAKHCTYFM